MRRLLGIILTTTARGMGLTCVVITTYIAILLIINRHDKHYVKIVVNILSIVLTTVISVAYIVYTFGLRLSSPVAADALKRDSRRPILLLRSFSDDHASVANSDRILGFEWLLGGKRIRTFEEALTAKLSAYGPVVAIGRPGETVPPLGASRLWVDHEQWQAKVEELLRDCQLVVMIVGEIKGKDGLAWEVCRLLSLKESEKVILVAPPVAEQVVERRWFIYHELSRGLIPPYQGGEIAARLSVDGACKVVRFGCRQDGDYLVALGDLIGPAPIPRKAKHSSLTPAARLRDFVRLLSKDGGDDYGAYRIIDISKRRPTWVDRHMWQVSALYLVIEVWEDHYAPENVMGMRRELGEIKESLERCQQMMAAAPGQSVEYLHSERHRLLQKLESVRRTMHKSRPESL